MRDTWRFAALLVCAALPGALAACGGDNGSDVSPTGAPAATVTAEDRSAAEPLLKAAALVAGDLPEGFTFQEEKFTTNGDEAEQESIVASAPTAQDLDQLGRILGYQAYYSRPAPATLTEATVSFQIETDVYRDSKGADDHFELIRQMPSDPEFIRAIQEGDTESQVRDVMVSPISFAKVGDDRMAFELKFKVSRADLKSELSFFTQIIGIRRGAGLGFMTVLAIGAPHPVDQLEDLARKLDERMKDALE